VAEVHEAGVFRQDAVMEQLQFHEDATTLADGGVAARDAARALARYHEARGNTDEAARWQSQAAPPGR
jgi:hypothetical protein